MVNLIVPLIPLLTLALLFCVWKAWSLLTTWRSAAAAVLSTDYTEAEQQNDFWSFGMLRGWQPFTDNDEQRLIEATVLLDTGIKLLHR